MRTPKQKQEHTTNCAFRESITFVHLENTDPKPGQPQFRVSLKSCTTLYRLELWMKGTKVANPTTKISLHE